MIDPLAAALEALTAHSPAAYGLVFVAGLATSIGPCVAPRYVAIAAIAGTRRVPWLPTAAFVCGIAGALMAIGFTAGLLGALWSMSSALYAVLGLALVTCGGVMLVRAVPDRLTGRACACDEIVRSTRPQPATQSLGAIFLLGAASAFVISPCCTPVVASIVATSTAIGKPGAGALLLLTYALGHTLPLVFAGNLGPAVGQVLGRVFPAQASSIVAAVLMLALGVYYAVLA